MKGSAMALISELVLICVIGPALAGDINRQAIIFYPETPDLFYCPQDKPISLEGMLVKAKPLKKLCEFEGRPLPKVKLINYEQKY
jgi:ATP-dependent DNA helicase 2 subunit 2